MKLVYSIMRLIHCTNEIWEYQVELVVTIQKDEDAVRRIQELERQAAIMENNTERIYTKGMIT